MQITYDGMGSFRIKFDNGRELDLDEILDLDKVLTLTRTSREWNRKRVIELEDELERNGRKLEAKLPSRNLYTDEEVATLQASETELVAGPLRRRIAELERTLAGAIDREAKLEEKVQGYDTDRHTERDRADRITREHEACAGNLELREKDADTFRRQRNELETRVKELTVSLRRSNQSLRARDNLLGAATLKIEQAQEIIHDSQVQEAMEAGITRHAVTLAKALQDVSNTLA